MRKAKPYPIDWRTLLAEAIKFAAVVAIAVAIALWTFMILLGEWLWIDLVYWLAAAAILLVLVSHPLERMGREPEPWRRGR